MSATHTTGEPGPELPDIGDYAPKRQAQIQALYDDRQRLDDMPVDRFVDLLAL